MLLKSPLPLADGLFWFSTGGGRLVPALGPGEVETDGRVGTANPSESFTMGATWQQDSYVISCTSICTVQSFNSQWLVIVYMYSTIKCKITYTDVK